MAGSPSAFDSAFIASWDLLKSVPGLFRNPVYEATQRRPLGASPTGPSCGSIVQFNPEHLKNKRPTSFSAKAADVRLARPFEPALFHFGKARAEEVVAWVAVPPLTDDDAAPPWLVWAAAGQHAATAPLTREPAPPPASPPHPHAHAMFANISPIMGAHALLVPEMHACHPQVMNTRLLGVALRMMALAGRRDFHLGFNSLGAWASVNHCHFHVTYVGDAFPDGHFAVETAAASRLASAALPGGATLQLDALVGWPLGGFRFRVAPDAAVGGDDGSSDRGGGGGGGGGSSEAPPARHVRALAAAAGALVEHMVASEVAHNLLLADRGRTVYVIPRLHQSGAITEDGRMGVAFAETSGIAIVYSQEVFDSNTEAEFVAALVEYRMAEDVLAGLARVGEGGLHQAAAAAARQSGDGAVHVPDVAGVSVTQ